MNDKNKIYIASFDKPIKITFEGFPIEIKNGEGIVKIPISYISDTKFGVICQDDFTPERWAEIEKWAEEENKKIDMGED